MDLAQVKTYLASENPQDRMRGITALRDYEAAIAAPLLMDCREDGEAIVRSFVAMGLGYKQSLEGLAVLREMVEHDADPNVRGEACGALGKYGRAQVPLLATVFEQDQHWLLRMSILLAVADLDCPEVFLSLCTQALAESDEAVKSTALEQLPSLVGTPQEGAGLALLLAFVGAESWNLRRVVATALQCFAQPEAKAALLRLRQDPVHQVVAATLETLLF